MRTASVNATRLIGALVVSAAVGWGATLLAAPAPQMTPQQRVDAAYKAMGGEKLAALKSVRIEAEIGQWDPGASFTLADNLKPDQGMSKLVQTRDLTKGMARNEWTRPRAGGGAPHLHRDRHAHSGLFDRQRRGRRPAA